MKNTTISAAVLAAVLAAAAAAADGAGSVTISPASQKLAGVATVRARSASQAETLLVTGRVLQDAKNLFHLKAGADGTFTDAGVRLGQAVNRGQLLGSVVAGSTVAPVIAGVEGVVTGAAGEPGAPVRAGEILFTVTGTDPVWAVLDVPEKEIAKLRLRQPARVKSASYPGRAFAGETEFISPEIEEVSRTVKVRARMPNPGGLLKFGMFVTAELPVADDKPSVYVPLDALQRMPDAWLVFVRVAPDRFEARKVSPGRETATEVEITSGLRSGEMVAAKGAFILKSEMMKDQLGGE